MYVYMYMYMCQCLCAPLPTSLITGHVRVAHLPYSIHGTNAYS